MFKVVRLGINGISRHITPPSPYNPPLLSTDLRAPQGKFWRKNPYFLGILWYFLCVFECFEDILQHKIALKLHFRTENPPQSPQKFLACGGLSSNDSSGTNALILQPELIVFCDFHNDTSIVYPREKLIIKATRNASKYLDFRFLQ